jgi:hypothetical protein
MNDPITQMRLSMRLESYLSDSSLEQHVAQKSCERESEESMDQYECLPQIISEKPCPNCKELLYWSQNEDPPKVDFNTRTGYVRSVELVRFCLNCGYREVGSVTIGKDPVWTSIEAVI